MYTIKMILRSLSACIRGKHEILLARWLAGSLAALSIFPSALMAQQSQPPATPARKNAVLSTPAGSTPVRKQNLRSVSLSPKARDFYQLNWGVDALAVKAVESGQMIRFSYYVLNASKAAPLNDKKSNPVLVDPQARVSLIVPSMENVGQLRQSSTPEAGKSYWMVFSNKGSLVKPGDRVSVQIGKFHVDGLQVE